MDFDYDAMENIDEMELKSVATCSGWLEIDDCGGCGPNDD